MKQITEKWFVSDKSNPIKRKFSFTFIFSIIILIIFSNYAFSQKLKVNELGYFEARGLNVFVFSNEYNGMFFDEKTAGVEIIHHGVRTSSGGAVRLQNTPVQWDPVTKVIDRKIDKENNSIEVKLRYKEFNFDSRVNVMARDNGLEMSVYLDEPLPKLLQCRAGFNLEFLPSSYFEKTFLVDGKPGIFQGILQATQA